MKTLYEAINQVRQLNEESISNIVKKHINAYSVADDPYDVAVSIGKRYKWSQKQIEAAEKIISKKYIK
jgi:hypothetical protein